MSYTTKRNFGWNQHLTAWLGNAKNFWKRNVVAKNESEARELKNLMDASSLSHFQAKKLAIYALANPSDEYWAFAMKQLNPRKISHRAWFTVMEVINLLKTVNNYHDWVDVLQRDYQNLPSTIISTFAQLYEFKETNPEDWELFYKFITNRHYLHPFIEVEKVREEQANDPHQFDAWKKHLIENVLTDTVEQDNLTLQKQDIAQNFVENLQLAAKQRHKTMSDVYKDLEPVIKQFGTNPPIDIDPQTIVSEYLSKEENLNDKASTN